MARRDGYEKLYTSFELFRDRCLLSDRSLVWPDAQVWTRTNVAELQRRLVENPITTPASFEEKLEAQLAGASKDLWVLMADLYFIYFLPSTFIKPFKKLGDIEWAAKHAGREIPSRSDPFWEPLEGGFTRTSMKYHFKYAQFWLLILFAENVKTAESPRAIIESPEAMQSCLDTILQGIQNPLDRAYDMRHALLYLAFPDEYERIISTRDKQRIVAEFGKMVKGKVPEDLDQALLRIRNEAGPELVSEGQALDFYQQNLKTRWRAVKDSGGKPVPPEPPPAIVFRSGEELDEILGSLAITRNIILYGPPGTGKTYLAKVAAEKLVESQLAGGKTESAIMLRVIEGLVFYEVLALAMYLGGPPGRYSVPQIEGLPLVAARYQTSPVRNPRQNIWGNLQSHTGFDSQTVKVARRWEPFLFDKGEHSDWHLTVAGREYVETELQGALETMKTPAGEGQRVEDFVEWVTFHQSYSYEDFVEGLRPVPSEDDSTQITYEIVPGTFRRVSALATADPSNSYVLVIDEINRANISKVLGELITLLEDDKRSNGLNPLSVRLPYSHDQFSVPGNLFIVGTMNTADRSIALLDVALRRRFAFVEIMPRSDLLEDTSVRGADETVDLKALLDTLNAGLSRLLDRDHQVGHSYLLQVAGVPETERLTMLEFVWNQQILPLLEEYFYSHPDQLLELLPSFLDLDTTSEETTGMGAAPPGIPRLTGEDLAFALAKLTSA
jgi:5-methylcytosine-specific restriction protein B